MYDGSERTPATQQPLSNRKPSVLGAWVALDFKIVVARCMGLGLRGTQNGRTHPKWNPTLSLQDVIILTANDDLIMKKPSSLSSNLYVDHVFLDQACCCYHLVMVVLCCAICVPHTLSCHSCEQGQIYLCYTPMGGQIYIDHAIITQMRCPIW